jgi:peptide/nickel transport system substrate-binding protein
VGTVLTFAAACGSDEDSPAGGSQPVAGGTLRYATAVEPECLDPEVAARDVDALIDRNIFDSLVSYSADGTFQPWLAQRWEISEDGKTYTFTLRPGVTFHDGTPLDAAAVKATLDHAVDPKAKSYYAASLIGAYDGATVVDEHTLEVHLSRANAPFLQALSTSFLGIQSPRSLADNAGDLCENPVGSGPFTFTGWTKGSNVRLERNPDYDWGPADAGHTGPAHLAGITFQFIPEDSVRLGALTSGQVEAIGDVPANSVKQVKQTSQLLTAPAPGAVYTLLLNSRSGPLTDERVRIAFQRSINLDQLVKSVYFGNYQRAWSVLSPSTLGYDPTTEGTWTYDPALADRLLTEAGWTERDADGYRTKDGRRLVLKWPYATALMRDQRETFGQGIQAEAKKAGIDVQFAAGDPGSLNTALSTGKNLDVFAMSFVRAEPDILRYFFASDQRVTQGGANVFQVADSQLDKWFSQATADEDPASRAKYFAQVQQYLNEHALALPTYVPTYLLGASKSLRGIRFEPQAYPLFYDSWLAR